MQAGKSQQVKTAAVTKLLVQRVLQFLPPPEQQCRQQGRHRRVEIPNTPLDHREKPCPQRINRPAESPCLDLPPIRPTDIGESAGFSTGGRFGLHNDLLAFEHHLSAANPNQDLSSGGASQLPVSTHHLLELHRVAGQYFGEVRYSCAVRTQYPVKLSHSIQRDCRIGGRPQEKLRGLNRVNRVNSIRRPEGADQYTQAEKPEYKPPLLPAGILNRQDRDGKGKQTKTQDREDESGNSFGEEEGGPQG